MRKLQLYITEEQYRLLKQRAGELRSIAQVVRELIDKAETPNDPTEDPFYRHVSSRRTGSGRSYRAAEAKKELYERPR